MVNYMNISLLKSIVNNLFKDTHVRFFQMFPSDKTLFTFIAKVMYSS